MQEELFDAFDHEAIDRQVENIKATPVYTLNAGQQTAFDWLVPFCFGKQPGWKKARFTGFAGTGKSFTMNRIVEEVRRTNKNIHFGMTAPTHKAVRVLKKFSEMPHEMEFGTIHSFLGLKEKTNWETGEKTYEPEYGGFKKERRIDSVNVLVVDESSMLPDALFEYIENEQRSNPGLRVIYMGDRLQIPPVRTKEEKAKGVTKDARPFVDEVCKSLGIYMLELTEPQRQAADSPIIMYSYAIRTNPKNKITPFVIMPEMNHALQLVPKKISALNEVFQMFKTEDFQKDPDFIKVIAWRNDTVDYFNKHIRLLINNATELPRYLEGEKLVMREAIVDDGIIAIAKNEEVVTKNIKVLTIKINYQLFGTKNFLNSNVNDPLADTNAVSKEFLCKVYKTDLVTPEEFAFSVYLLHEDSEQDYNIIYKQLEQAAKRCKVPSDKRDAWKQMYGFADNFAWVDYNYALTAHKSQGSSYNYCVSMEWDIDVNQDVVEMNRIKYVSATRARNKLFICK